MGVVLRFEAVLAGSFALIGASLSVALLAFPGLLGSWAGALMVFGWLIAFQGFAVMIATALWEGIVAARRGLSRRRRRSAHRTPTAGLVERIGVLPKRLIWGFVVVVLASAVSAAVGAVDSRGFSRNPEGMLNRCPWSIGKNHGLTNTCVSHARWAATGNDFVRMFVALCTVFLVVVCASAEARRRIRASSPGHGGLAAP